MSNIDKLNNIHAKVAASIHGSIHNTLWQIMVNDSLDGSEAAFVDIPGQDSIAIALGDGGYIPANFNVIGASDTDRILEILNHDVFGLTPDGADNVLFRSMRG